MSLLFVQVRLQGRYPFTFQIEPAFVLGVIPVVRAVEVAQRHLVFAVRGAELEQRYEVFAVGGLDLPFGAARPGPRRRSGQETVLGHVERDGAGGLRIRTRGGYLSLENLERADFRTAIEAQGFQVDVHEVVEVRAVIALRVGAGRADVVRVRIAENLDQTGAECCFLAFHRRAEVVGRGALLSKKAGGLLRTIERLGRVVQCDDRPFVDLLEVRLAPVDVRGADVKWYGVARQAQWVQAAVRVVRGTLRCQVLCR